jgi:CheY-like chemotaxis protein
LALINDILDISKIEADGIILEKVDFDLEYLIESVLSIVKCKVQGGDVELLFEYSPDAPVFFTGDPTRIRQVALNLLSNAVKFTATGEIRVAVKASEAEAGAAPFHTVTISVSDTGIGIAPEKQEAIFGLFAQADDTTTRNYGGTGLGLSIARALARKMGGDIRVASEPGKGSEFTATLRLPAAKPTAMKDILPVKAHELAGRKIAIVDDNENTLRLTEAYCREGGMNVVFRAGRGEDLLAWLEGQKDMPEAILADLMMPGMDGIAMAGLLRKDAKYNGIRLIAVTSDARPGAAAEFRQAGFDAYLPKPVTRKELIRVIRTALGRGENEKEIITRHMAEELSLKGIKVLVAEDKAANQKLMKAYLEMFGCIGDYAANGTEAVEKMKNNSYDVCLMDIQMPGMDGLEATRLIRGGINKDIPIIALTAAAMSGDRERSLTGGMNDYLVKPVDHKRLKEMLLKWVKA